MKQRVSIHISTKHHALLQYMVLILSITRKESQTSLLERLVLTFAKQMITNIKDDVFRGKLLNLINEAEKK